MLRHFAGSKLLGQFAYTVDARGNRIQAYEAVARATTGATTYNYNDTSIDYYLGIWTDSAPFKVSNNFSASMRVAFAGSGNATLKMGVGSTHSIYDVYVDGDLWRSVDGYATSASDVTLTISLPGEGPHVLDIRNRAEKNLQSSGYTIRFESFATSSTARQFDLPTLNYVYDAVSRLLSADIYPGSNIHATATRHDGYTYDVAGNRTQQVSPSGTTNYTFDAANRLTSSGAMYDAAGHMTSDGVNTYAWDRANRLLSMGVSAYLYDAWVGGYNKRLGRMSPSTCLMCSRVWKRY